MKKHLLVAAATLGLAGFSSVSGQETRDLAPTPQIKYYLPICGPLLPEDVFCVEPIDWDLIPPPPGFPVDAWLRYLKSL